MDFKDVLYDLQSNSKELKTFGFPLSQKFFQINLNTRKIEAPENLSVRFDHNAETVFFVVDRYFDTVDLTKQNWIVQYQNANPDKTKGTYLYYPSYYSLADNDTKIIFPWVIEGAATAYSGDVFFAVRFYTLNSNKEFIYNLNTIPSSSKVLYGMDATGEVSNYIYEADPAQDIINRLILIEDKISNLGTGGDISQEDILNLNQRIDDLEEIINNLDYGNIDPQEIVEIKNKLNNLEISIKDLEEIPNEVENLKSSYNSLSEEFLKISQRVDNNQKELSDKLLLIDEKIESKVDKSSVEELLNTKVDSTTFADFLIDLNSSLDLKVNV